MNILLNPTALPVKKQWSSPELILIGQGAIGNKAQITHHEASFTAISTKPGSYHFHGAGTFPKGVATSFVS